MNFTVSKGKAAVRIVFDFIKIHLDPIGVTFLKSINFNKHSCSRL